MSFLQSLFGASTEKKADISTVLDMVTFTAGLAANPTAIDSLLDVVRQTTARTTPGQPLAPEDEERLLAVYLQLEQYLTTKEPVRSYTKDELRGRLNPDLRQRLSVYETKASM